MQNRRGANASFQHHRLVGGLCAMGMVAAACSSGSVESPSDRAEEANQELVIGYGGDPWVDSEGDRKRLPSYPLNADVCETLVQLGSDYSLKPSLAKEWNFVGNNTFRFLLREGATFSDGTPVDARAGKILDRLHRPGAEDRQQFPWARIHDGR